jgi:hypothetical protein
MLPFDNTSTFWQPQNEHEKSDIEILVLETENRTIHFPDSPVFPASIEQPEVVIISHHR